MNSSSIKIPWPFEIDDIVYGMKITYLTRKNKRRQIIVTNFTDFMNTLNLLLKKSRKNEIIVPVKFGNITRLYDRSSETSTLKETL